MASVQDQDPGINFPIPIKFTTASMSAGTMTAGWITGSAVCVLNNSGATPGTQTTRTATEMIADGSLCLGQTWLLVVFNSVTTNTLTIGAGAGVTLSGTMTVLAFSAGVFTAKVMSVTTPAITITRVFSFGGGATNFGAVA